MYMQYHAIVTFMYEMNYIHKQSISFISRFATHYLLIKIQLVEIVLNVGTLVLIYI